MTALNIVSTLVQIGQFALDSMLLPIALVQARGRIVGIHETLIGLASILGPLIIVVFGANKPTTFWIATTIIAVSIVPIFISATIPAIDKQATIDKQTNFENPSTSNST